MLSNDEKANKPQVMRILDALDKLNAELKQNGDKKQYTSIPYEPGTHPLDERAKLMGYEPIGLDILFGDPDGDRKLMVPMIAVTLPEELSTHNDGVYTMYINQLEDGNEQTLLGVVIPNSKSRESLIRGVVQSLDNHMATLKHPDLQPYDYLQIMYQFIEHNMVNNIAKRTFPDDATVRRIFEMEYSPQVFLALAMYASGRDEMTVQEEAFNAQPYLVMKNVEQQMKELADKDKERDGDANE